MNKVVRQYVGAVKKHLVCPAEYRKKFLERVTKEVEACLEENPGASFDDLEPLIGPPHSTAESCLEEVPPAVLSAYVQKRKQRKRIGIIILAVFAMLLILLIVYIGHMHTGFTGTVETTAYAPQDTSVPSLSSAVAS